jgi:Kef-type K+ transport system membrane component KefB
MGLLRVHGICKRSVYKTKGIHIWNIILRNYENLTHIKIHNSNNGQVTVSIATCEDLMAILHVLHFLCFKVFINLMLKSSSYHRNTTWEFHCISILKSDNLKFTLSLCAVFTILIQFMQFLLGNKLCPNMVHHKPSCFTLLPLWIHIITATRQTKKVYH